MKLKRPDLPIIPWTMTTRWSADEESDSLELQTLWLPFTDADEQTPFSTTPFCMVAAIFFPAIGIDWKHTTAELERDDRQSWRETIGKAVEINEGKKKREESFYVLSFFNFSWFGSWERLKWSENKKIPESEGN